MRITSLEKENVQRMTGRSEEASRPSIVERRRPPASGDGSSGALRGFAAMSSRRRREIASLGGRAAHAAGAAHEFSSDEAREAGRKGSTATSRNRAHMATIGRLGAQRRVQNQNELAP